jgi:predicted nucleic acid-binding protein
MRAGDRAAQAADAFIDALHASVVPADRSIARTAARLRARHARTLRLPDALVVATAIESGATLTLATDQGWPSIEGTRVEVVGPGMNARSARPASDRLVAHRLGGHREVAPEPVAQLG